VDDELSGKGIAMLMAIHGAVRRDLDRLASAVGVLADPAISVADRGVGAAGLATYWDCFGEQLHHHHTIEDAEVFPYLRKSLAGRGVEVLDAMGAEHEAIDDTQAGLDAALEELVAHPTAANAKEVAHRLELFRRVVVDHLAHEEAEAVPLIVEGFDAEYWTAFMSRRQQDDGPDAFLPWVLDGAPAPAVAQVTGELPPPVRELLVTQWVPAHESRVSALPR
jgi:hemerythrin-like domain-containing protein